MSKRGEQNIWQRIGMATSALFWKNKIAAGLIYTSLLMNGLVFLGLFQLVKHKQGVLIAHYNAFFGIDVIVDTADRGDLENLFLAPIGGIFFLGLSVLMSIFLILQLDRDVVLKGYKKNNFISNRAIGFMGSRVLLIGAWLLQLILVVYLIATFLVNK